MKIRFYCDLLEDLTHHQGTYYYATSHVSARPYPGYKRFMFDVELPVKPVTDAELIVGVCPAESE